MGAVALYILNQLISNLTISEAVASHFHLNDDLLTLQEEVNAGGCT